MFQTRSPETGSTEPRPTQGAGARGWEGGLCRQVLTSRCGDRGRDGIPVQQLLGQAPPAAMGDSSGLRHQAWGPASSLLWNHHSKSVSDTLAAAAWRREWGSNLSQVIRPSGGETEC